ncbi:MAG: ogr/Delta-like zinc finger family protein [Candidatus Accumulibacter sp.]|uniref:ogr/Delta-like zinc finger family protein n=1 Tax=Betaproteobacteria TaxID=28216 RepID=UPI001ACA4AA9|nr:ogr/Delta-like zinc finger family protein [Accumulibacter sp.]MBN8438452.1 ogr/Delta-like zinc finger family protein [Accumulibacter sp.]MBN8473160.1 ogr/Delta-like zinc finger family protein [Sulfuritalea sp.]
MRITCPHCNATVKVRSSTQVSSLIQEGYCQCTNIVCGHTFRIVTEVVATIAPSAVPDPDVSIQNSSRPRT